jgi:hypothetical protein
LPLLPNIVQKIQQFSGIDLSPICNSYKSSFFDKQQPGAVSANTDNTYGQSLAR